jgi:hypothetical protein
VRHQRTHAECLGKRERLSVVFCGWGNFQGLTTDSNVTEEAQGIRLRAAFLVLMGERQGTFGKSQRILQVAG